MEDETFSNPTAEELETDTTEETTTESTQVEEESEDIRYINQKKRAEKAEAELKAMKELMKSINGESAKPKEAKKPITSDRDETFVISALGSKGLSYEEINVYLDKAKKIAQVEEIPLAKVLDSDYFKTFDKSYQDNKKQELAALGASRGSGGAVSKKTLQTPGLTDQEHNELLKKALGLSR